VGVFRIFRAHVYVQVVFGIIIGTILGVVAPKYAVEMKFMADIFVKLIKMCIGPLVFLAVVHGIKSAGNITTAGRVGIKAIVYFEVGTTIAMLCGWLAGEVIRPGAGLNAKISDLDPSAVTSFSAGAQQSAVGGFTNFIPHSLFQPFVQGDILQVLFIAIIAGISLLILGERGWKMADWFDQAMHLMFTFMALITRLAPFAAFGAISFTIGKFGLASLLPLAKLIISYYIAAAIFVFGVLWVVLLWCRVGLIEFFRYIMDEILIVFGTIASEAVLPRLMSKMEYLGCKDSVVRLVLPTAYSFNLDGTALYLVLAPLFIQQALNIELSWEDKLSLFFILLVTSKGAAGVTGGVLVTLVSTLVAHPIVPAAGIALTLGVDRFLNEGRAVLNLIGNAVATLAISRWDGALDEVRMRQVLSGKIPPPEVDEGEPDIDEETGLPPLPVRSTLQQPA
jgi:aerobic C4-dicarboxylate transport protein